MTSEKASERYLGLTSEKASETERSIWICFQTETVSKIPPEIFLLENGFWNMNTETSGIESEIFEYLYDLRDSGIVNMWGSPPFLQDRFGLTRNESRDYFFKWMDFVSAQATRDNPYKLSTKEST